MALLNSTGLQVFWNLIKQKFGSKISFVKTPDNQIRVSLLNSLDQVISSEELNLPGALGGGYIQEFLSIGMWRVIKFSNGMALIWGRKAFHPRAEKAWGSVYYSTYDSNTYPFTWASDPWEIAQIDNSGNFWHICKSSPTTKKSGSYYTVSPSQYSSNQDWTSYMTYIVCGWWK